MKCGELGAISAIAISQRDAANGGMEKEKRMANDTTKTMLTETDALALCLAPVLDGAKSFGANDCEKAHRTLDELRLSNRIDTATWSRCGARLGNHSAVRQWAIKQGFLPASDAPEDALAKAVKAIFAKSDATLEKMAK